VRARSVSIWSDAGSPETSSAKRKSWSDTRRILQ
jgi:hypothetical protein